jgi:hypothetical protein
MPYITGPHVTSISWNHSVSIFLVKQVCVDSVVNHSQVPLNCGAIVPRVSSTNLMDVATLGL